MWIHARSLTPALLINTMLLIGCGGGEDFNGDNTLGPNGNATNTSAVIGFDLAKYSVTSRPQATRYIEARSGFQCMDFAVKGGDQIYIFSTGSWSGGQRALDAQGKPTLPLIVDANGGNGKVYNNLGQVIDGPSFAPQVIPNFCEEAAPCNVVGIRTGTYCDASLEVTIPNITAAQKCNGSSPASALFVTVPGTPDAATTLPMNLNTNNNMGPICSSKDRIQTYLYGTPNRMFPANHCLPIAKNRLIGKIVPLGIDPKTVPAFDVGKMYEQTALTVPASTPAGSNICFRANDGDTGTVDNSGSLLVSVMKKDAQVNQ